MTQFKFKNGNKIYLSDIYILGSKKSFINYEQKTMKY